MARRKKPVRMESAHQKVDQQVKTQKRPKEKKKKGPGPSNARLQKLAARHCPPQAWYDENMDGVY